MDTWNCYTRSVPSAFTMHRSGNTIETKDIELEAQLPLVPSIQEEELRRIAHALFGVEDIHRLHLSWLSCYRAHLHHQISTVGGKWMKPVLSALVTDGHDVNSGHCIQFVCEICNIICDYGSSPSIDDTLQNWLRKHGGDLTKLDATLAKSARLAVFCVVAWATLLVRVSPNAIGDAFEIVGHEDRAHPHAIQGLDSARRPISALLRAFCRPGLVPGINNSSDTEAGREDLIHVTVVNYAMLLQFGRVTIEWTEDLSSHLIFVSASRTLYLFRMPTVCALACIEDGAPRFFDRALQDYYPQSVQFPQLWLRLRQEVLLSYRILFGQDRPSRKLFRKMMNQAQTKNLEVFSDPLLQILCSERTRSAEIQGLPPTLWPKSCRTIDSALLKLDEYNCTSDMPLLGQRLLVLQEFNLRQRPRTFWGLWRDKRNKPQWYTFWVVLIVGGIALVLTILQLGVAVAQLVIETKSKD